MDAGRPAECLLLLPSPSALAVREGIACLCPKPRDLWGLSGPQVADGAMWDISGGVTCFVCM